MKFLFFVIGLGSAFGLGLFPSINKARPAITKWVCFLFIACATFFALYPPIIGTFADAVRAHQFALANEEIAVVVKNSWTNVDSALSLDVVNPPNTQIVHLQFASLEDVETARRLGSETEVLLRVVNSGSHDRFRITKVVGEKPFVVLPYIPALEERSRIMFFHVPMSWVGFLAFFMTLLYSILYLRSNNVQWETKAAASAGLGTLFCALAYITGALWAKFSWGHFFNWDTRELSLLILLLIYGAYFALRSSIHEVERRARLSSVYAIISCVAALFLMFIIPRMTESLHPGSRTDDTAGPLLSPQADAINLTKALIFSLALSGFTLLYFWILSLRVRADTVNQKLQSSSQIE